MNINQYLIYRAFVPKYVRMILLKKILRFKIRKYYFGLGSDKINEEQKAILDFLEDNPVSLFPYPFRLNYQPEHIRVFYDKSNKMRYVLQEGRKLYFKRGWSSDKVSRAYAALAMEQDIASPHCYLSKDFTLGSEDAIADIGASEGNFSLSQIEKVKKIYLIDYDREWIRALEATFEPWKDKVEIISKYVGDSENENETTLDNILKVNKDITFMKIDVEGFEQKVLDGATEFLMGDLPLKFALCTYHKHNDEQAFTDLLQKSGFKIKPSSGYLIPLYDKKIKSPWLRRGLIRATR
jgi:hypothetical protein